MRIKLIIYGLVSLLIALSLVYSADLLAKYSSSGKTGSSRDIQQGFEPISTGSTETGDVSVELTPLESFEGRLRVKIAANTHSVDLTQFDLMKITTLERNGKFIKPETAPALEGHHSSGTLVFNFGERLSGFTIRIKGIPKVEERLFEWR